jgi:uncharacterized OB-fold protein
MAETADWWEATRVRRLVVQACTGCGHVQHPPRPLCLRCGGTAMSWRTLPGRATVDAWTEVHRSPRPDLTPPYIVARVRLDDGPLLLTRLVGDGPYRCGSPVAVEWEPLGDGRHLPVFRLIEE